MMRKKNPLARIRVTYNAPVTLTFGIISAVLLLIDSTLLDRNLIPAIFTASGGPQSAAPFNIHEPLDYIRMILHIFGHSDWNHLISNMAFILLLGPMLEERYGSPVLALMMSVTSLVTGVLNACFGLTPMIGSSDIAFMMILLTSFTSLSKNEIPLSFILILVLYIGRELVNRTAHDNIATFAHIAGGLCGSLFAFLASPRQRTPKQPPKKKTANEKDGDYMQTNMQTSAAKKRLAEIDAASPRLKNRKPAKQTSDSDTTVIGSIKL